MTNQEKIEQIKKHFNIKTDPVYSVKNVKSFMGREGYGFEASLYKHGKRVGSITDVADGSGQLQYNMKHEDIKAYQEYAAEKTKEKFEGDMTLACEIVTAFEVIADLKKETGKAICFFTPTHGVGEYTCQPASRTKLPTAAYRSLTGDAITTMLGRIKEKRAGVIVFNRLLDDLV